MMNATFTKATFAVNPPGPTDKNSDGNKDNDLPIPDPQEPDNDIPTDVPARDPEQPDTDIPIGDPTRPDNDIPVRDPKTPGEKDIDLPGRDNEEEQFVQSYP